MLMRGSAVDIVVEL